MSDARTLEDLYIAFDEARVAMLYAIGYGPSTVEQRSIAGMWFSSATGMLTSLTNSNNQFDIRRTPNFLSNGQKNYVYKAFICAGIYEWYRQGDPNRAMLWKLSMSEANG